ncbi:hypothetical protein SRABI133_01533 [Peribacillus simplex]|uniref:Uncharacterized protein n=1 Tax=Peribacillus simplex TaxID=1478 RepID=A0A9W4KSW7_9BACI|nr:hypothetical protein SRABI133_01533 [Peribacillus simplex]
MYKQPRHTAIERIFMLKGVMDIGGDGHATTVRES